MRKPIEIWFQDEARIGQKNGLVRQWAKRGTRPRQSADQRYESAYLFGAICPARGTGAALALPFADTQAMQLHLDEIARTVKRGAHAVLLLDRAGWHTGTRQVPSRKSSVRATSGTPRRKRRNWTTKLMGGLGARTIEGHAGWCPSTQAGPHSTPIVNGGPNV